MIDQVLIIDTETTGIDPDNGQVIEVGAILYSVKHQTAIQQVSTLLPALENPAEKINQISPAPLSELEMERIKPGLEMMLGMARQAEYAIAHNADFDRQWFRHPKDTLPLFVGTRLPALLDASGQPLQWICTCTDFDWPRQARPGQSLIDLALAHGIGVAHAHRALSDCQLIAELFNRSEDLQKQFAQALSPKVLCIALVSYDERDLAKQAGFKWKSETKTWERRITMMEIENLPFKVKLF